MYLSGARTPILDAAARYNMLNADTHDMKIPLGILVQPLTGRYLDDGADYYEYCGIDNGCFTEIGQQRYNEAKYLALIDRGLETFGDGLLFATAQDVAFDWEGTLRKSLPVLPKIRAVGAPAALVLQDGATIQNVPWDELDAVFIGGSTEWKVSEMAKAISFEAKRRHKWVHMGRVNSMKRMRIAQSFRCDSADGTYLLHMGKSGRVREGIENVIEWLRDMWKNDPTRELFDGYTYNPRLGVPVTGCGSITTNMAKARRKKARPNANAKTVLDSLGGSTKGVYRSYEPLTDEPEELPLSRFKTVEKYEKDRVEREPEKHVLISDYLIFSGYTGSDVERSNVRVFFKEHGDKPGVYRVYGGYGTDGIAIRLDVADEGILEDLERLEDYPMLDEDDVGAVSLELADEAAESYGYGDFEREINKQFGVTIIEDSKSQKLRDLFWQATQDLPEGFVVETGGNVHFDIERMVEGLSDDALEEAGIEYESDED